MNNNHKETNRKKIIQEETNATILINNEQVVNELTQENQTNNEKAAPTKEDKKHRRSKKDSNDRLFACPECNKKYLSRPALSSHKKSKHSQDKAPRGRGRPKKFPMIPLKDEKELAEFFDFFTNVEQLPDDNECMTSINLIDKLQESLEKLHRSSCLKMIVTNDDDITQVCLYQYCLKFDIEKTQINTESPQDAIVRYLIEFKEKTNMNYYMIMIDFLVLLLDCYYLEGKAKEEKERIKIINSTNTQRKQIAPRKWTAAKLPELCNVFIIDHLPSLPETVLTERNAMNLIQHFCCWLNLNSYSKTLIAANDNYNNDYDESYSNTDLNDETNSNEDYSNVR